MLSQILGKINPFAGITMAVYNVSNPKSYLHSVEFTPVSDGNFSFFYLKDGAHKDEARQWLTKEVGQEVIAESMVCGRPVIITHGEKPKQDMLKLLDEHGDTTQLKVIEKPPNFWAIRGGMSIVGQCLQLASSTFQVEKLEKGHAQLKPNHPQYNPKLKQGMWVRKAFSPDIGAFAILNLTANAMNIMYGAQKEEATNQLHAIKSDLNANLNDHITASERTFDVRDNRAHLHKDDDSNKKSAFDKVNDALAENSVRVGEIGLRYLGALALVFPYNKLGAGIAELKKGNLGAAWKVSKNSSQVTLAAGGLYLLGKTMALFAKVPDPYDDKPKTTWDTLREEYLFKVGGLVEAVAGGTVGYNAFAKKKIGFSNGKTPDIKNVRADYLGGVGGTLFATGYIVRYWAKYGTKHLDTEEVFAHATDTLAKTPPEKLPQLMADSSATIMEHLKDTKVEYGEVFTKMMTDMYRYHHIALDNLGTEPAERDSKAYKSFVRKDPHPDQAPVGRHTFPRSPKTPAEIAAAQPAGNFAERNKETSTQAGLPGH